VIQRLCHRCHSVLHIEDEGSLIFCWNCGAAQVTLSEELQEQAATQRSDAAASAQNPSGYSSGTGVRDENPANQPQDLLIIWKSVIRTAAAVAAVLSVASILLPPLELLAWMAPAIVLAIYCARHRETRITAGVGARIGLVCGILTCLGITIATAAQMLVLRFGLHKGDQFQASMDAVLAQTKTQAVAQSGAASTAFFSQFSIPEFRAGFFLAGLGLLTAVLLVLSTAGGAFSGFMRSRARVR
jgi:predicted RNA-binding Zn-ribbon protein involved in translation (DUF1610 family)